jgi:hypothetical protein
VLLALSVVALLGAISLAQITEEAPAKRSLARSIAILSEVDAFLDDNVEALRTEAEASGGGTVEVAGFPVAVTLSSGDVLNNDDADIRAIILSRAATQMYDDGSSAFREQGDGETSTISTQRAIELWMKLVQPGPHDAFVVAAAVLAGITAVLAFVVLLTSPLHRGLVRAGLSVASGGLAVAGASGIIMLLLELASGGLDDYMRSEFAGVLADAAWAPLRNGLIALGGGVALAALGLVLAPRGRALDAAPTDPF